jgi:membrane-associated protease RseP (regulator of RpoE activity)
MRTMITGTALMLVLALATGSAGAQAKAEKKIEKKIEKHVVVSEAGDNGPGGWLGVSIQDVTPRLARERDLKTKSGALISDVIDESPAEKGGLKEDDIIVEFHGKTVEDASDLTDAVRATAPGTATQVTVYRDGEKKTLQITVGKEKKNRSYSFMYHGVPAPHMRIAVPPVPKFHMYSMNDMFGLSLIDLNRQLGEYFGAPGGRGVLVMEVERKSAAAKAGFKAGDVIVRVGKETVETTDDLSEAIEDVKEGEKAEFGVLRKGTATTITVEGGDLSDSHMGNFRNFRFDGASTGYNRGEFQKQMQILKENLRTAGENLRLHMEQLRDQLRRELRSVAS